MRISIFLCLGMFLSLTVRALEAPEADKSKAEQRAAYIEKAKAIMSEGFAAWNDSRFGDSSKKFGELVTDESKKSFTEIYFDALLRKEKMDLLGLRSQRKAEFFDSLIDSINKYQWRSSFEREMFFGRVQRLRGSYLSNIGDYKGSNRSLDMAIASFKKLGKSGSEGWALLHRSSNYLSMGQVSEAERDMGASQKALKRGLKQEEQSFWSFYHRSRARMLARQGKLAEAEQELLHGLEKLKLSQPSLRFASLVLMEDGVVLAVAAGNQELAESRMKTLAEEAKGTGMEEVYRDFNAIWREYLKSGNWNAAEGSVGALVDRGYGKGRADWMMSLLEPKPPM
ncbi:MAG: hypothetical protein KDD43_04285 [Bdellovibrionales bacterium]|nr:hypothetical protein [Bdellovibrionales bacterium]